MQSSTGTILVNRPLDTSRQSEYTLTATVNDGVFTSNVGKFCFNSKALET